MNSIKSFSEIKNYQVFNSKRDLFFLVASELKRFSLMPEEQHICLSGGSTPKGLFAYILANDFVHTIIWNNLHFWWGDERCVQADDLQSNYGEAMRLLFNNLDICESNIHPIKINGNNHQISLKQFSNDMISTLKLNHGYPVFDWIILGVGDDGHTASLFPAISDLDSKDSALLVLKPGTQEFRISLSANTIRASKRVSYLVAGQSKADVMNEILTNDEASQNYPAALISSRKGNTEYLLDQQAGSLLKSREQTRGSCQ